MKCVPVQLEHSAALLSLMQHSNGCHCRWWHYEGDDYSWTERCNVYPQTNADELERALTAGHDEARGIVALDDERVVGWLKLVPSASMTKLFGRRVYRSLDCFGGDRDGVLIIGCVLIDPAWRRRGVARALVARAVEHGRDIGARSIEAFPRRPRDMVRDDELWMGPIEAFVAAGFEAIDGPEPYPVLRRTL
jgi:GNAT superfamily N-acetyltransferase